MRIKKFCLSLILCLILMPGLFVFTACGDDNSYSLSNLYTDYMTIVTKHEYLSLNSNHEIVFDYDDIQIQGNQNVSYIFLNKPYSNLTNFYNPLLNNSLKFFSSYFEVCSSNNLNVSASDRDALKVALDEFDSALTNMYNRTINVVDILRTGEDYYTDVHMTRLTNLFESYENLYTTAFNLSYTLSNIYFNYAITDANPNYSTQTLSEFDASRVVVNLRSRICEQIVNLSQVYIVNNVNGMRLYSSLVARENEEFPDFPSSFDDYIADVELIDLTFNSTLGSYINTSDRKEDFYHASIELYNIQECINNIKDEYNLACNEIVYTQIISDDNASDYQLTCAKIIEDYTALTTQNTIALNNALTILTENI